MNDITISLPKHLAIIILVVILVISFGGYTLYFHAQSKMGTKNRAYELLKEKQMHTEENYNELQKKFTGTNAEIKQINKDYEEALKKQQECKERLDTLQTNYDSLQQTNMLLQKNIETLQSKVGIKTSNTTSSNAVQPTNDAQATPSTTPVTETPSNNALTSDTTLTPAANTVTSETTPTPPTVDSGTSDTPKP